MRVCCVLFRLVLAGSRIACRNAIRQRVQAGTVPEFPIMKFAYMSMEGIANHALAFAIHNSRIHLLLLEYTFDNMLSYHNKYPGVYQC